MYEFIFLGLIPGTHIQVTFSVWLFVALLLGSALGIRRVKRNRTWRFANVHGKFSVPGRSQAARSS